MNVGSQLVTVEVLERVLDRKLDEKLDRVFDQKLSAFGRKLTEDITSSIRDELDSKLRASENRIVTTLRYELDERTDILLQAMSDMVEPMHARDDELDWRVTSLEKKIG